MSDFDRSSLLSFGVSRETLEKLADYEHLLKKWQAKLNLIANGTLDDIWGRHFADSLQLLPIAGCAAHSWVDMGSGGGFPGLPIGIHLAESSGAIMHLIERDYRKCAFLREAARITGAAVQIHHGSVEDVVPSLNGIDIVTSRALAPLPNLVMWSLPVLKKGGTGLFLRGQAVNDELTGGVISSNFSIELVRSKTSADGRVAVVKYHP